MVRIPQTAIAVRRNNLVAGLMAGGYPDQAEPLQNTLLHQEGKFLSLCSLLEPIDPRHINPPQMLALHRDVLRCESLIILLLSVFRRRDRKETLHYSNNIPIDL